MYPYMYPRMYLGSRIEKITRTNWYVCLTESNSEQLVGSEYTRTGIARPNFHQSQSLLVLAVHSTRSTQHAAHSTQYMYTSTLRHCRTVALWHCGLWNCGTGIASSNAPRYQKIRINFLHLPQRITYSQVKTCTTISSSLTIKYILVIHGYMKRRQ